MKRLIAHKMSLDIPLGGGLAAGVAFLLDPGKVSASARAATEWAEAAIRAVRGAASPNPWANADDEAIAGEVLRQVAARMRMPRG